VNYSWPNYYFGHRNRVKKQVLIWLILPNILIRYVIFLVLPIKCKLQMSYWVRTEVLRPNEKRDREKHYMKFIKTMRVRIIRVKARL
jgi:hypothetical protein